MSALTNYGENNVLDTLLSGTKYIKLHIGDPGEDAATNAAAETTRQGVTWAAASGGSKSTNATATWTSVSTTETYSHFSIWDALSAGNPLVYGALTASVSVTAGDDFEITSGNMTVTAA